MSEGFRAVTKTASWLMSEQFFGLAISVVVGLGVAALIGPGQMGVLAYATSTAALVSPAITALNPVLIRRLSTAEATRDVVKGAMGVSVTFGLLGFAVVVAFAAALPADEPSAAMTTLIAGLPLLLAGLTVGGPLLIAAGRAGVLARLRMIESALTGALRLGVAITLGLALVQQSVATLAAMASAVVTYRLARSHVPSAKSEGGARAEAGELLKEGWPFIVSAFAVALYMSSDQVMLGLLGTAEETGQYSVAVRFLSVSFAVPMALVTAVAPAIARAKSSSPTDYWDRLQRLASYSVSGAFVVALLTVGAAFVAVGTVLGQAYEASIPLLVTMLPSSVFVALGVARSQWIVNDRHALFNLVATAAGAALNVGLNLWLIPVLGATGAAVSTVIAYLFSDVLINSMWGPSRAYASVQLAALNPLRTVRILRADVRVLRDSGRG